MKIQEELLTATGISGPHSNERPEKFRARLVRAVVALPDSSWERLSKAAQKWTNEGIASMNNKEVVSDFPDSEEVHEEEEKKETLPRPLRGKGGSVVRELIIKNPDWDYYRVLEEAKKAGATMSEGTIEILIYDTRATLKVLKALDLLKPLPSHQSGPS